MTTVYFVRHAEPNYNNHDDELRELTEKGLEDRKLVTEYLSDKSIDVVLSSPYKRAVDTVMDFASYYSMTIEKIYDFRERKVDSEWIEDFIGFCKRQWADFNYKYTDGETLAEVQKRNISALKQVLEQYENKNIVIGSHGTALSTIINYYDPTYGFEEFDKIRQLMPWIVKLTFVGKKLIDMESVNVFEMLNE
ncbi:2,3-bisphosphoglycerate-dependent phosphoglycerate mutase [Anaerosporobacter mobilis DSM 15930]|uniref:2,3-bisphosphoglycerate-dependent phosphoglycerate mutase n=1 Tax=Anaerosporobacter mobilis DSM 15930 TaxID=1120996 RepID=A0A1M7KNT9_9FIRM|nr:histidine phosphatase family protein [Anaerosporobacter mobilis]SHM66639.1 2,3-bisphosphoglycerate-dependent phosphoglycerate mutase [Anaerosporobacter mobilis DSM 15930]